jgi:hypothetical protein
MEVLDADLEQIMNRFTVCQPLLNNICQSTYDEQMRSLLKESKVFGIALFGDGATIEKSPMMILLGSSPNNPFALLDIVDCTSEMAKGGKKDAKYIAGAFEANYIMD